MKKKQKKKKWEQKNKTEKPMVSSICIVLKERKTRRKMHRNASVMSKRERELEKEREMAKKGEKQQKTKQKNAFHLSPTEGE